ncbi:MAG TPA: hypothetical protein VNO14_09405, partial [Blastocatellia bacterium]|nr:hypothetical protein [Blastocatellia bacterium]
KFIAVSFGCMLVASSSILTFAQQDRGAIRITGRVSPALKLSLGSSLQSLDSIRAIVEEQGQDFIQIGLSGDSRSRVSQMSIPLQLRTNVGYELKLDLVNSSGCQPGLTVSVGSVRPSGQAVMTGAAEASRPVASSEQVSLNRPAIVLAGPRISARGGFRSAGNALLVDINLAIDEGREAGCEWHVSLRISLHSTLSHSL